MDRILPVGKIPVDLLARVLGQAPVEDPRLLLKPGVGLDCAVIDHGDTLLVYKSDPITFATDEIGWYLVQVNTNDIATTGAIPRWLMVTLLLPEGQTTGQSVERILQQVYQACRELNISVIGGHSEITGGLERPILSGTLIGEVSREDLITPQGARPRDRILLTKSVPIEATALLAREFPDRLSGVLSERELQQAREYLYQPGISVYQDARLARQAGRVTAMHDPTEGGLAGALWELAEASGYPLVFDPAKVPIDTLSARICLALDLDPLAAIASGALLLTAQQADAPAIRRSLEAEGIPCAEIGQVEAGPIAVWQITASGREIFPRPARDAIASLFEV